MLEKRPCLPSLALSHVLLHLSSQAPAATAGVTCALQGKRLWKLKFPRADSGHCPHGTEASEAVTCLGAKYHPFPV